LDTSIDTWIFCAAAIGAVTATISSIRLQKSERIG